MNDVLKEFFTLDTPLGSTVAISETTSEASSVFNSYYDQNNYPMSQMKKNPTMIVGRRGSGKTDALMSYSLYSGYRSAKYAPIVYFSAQQAAGVFNTLVGTISSQIEEKQPKPLVESVTELWQDIMWYVICCKLDELHSESSDSDNLVIRQYVRDHEIQISMKSPYQLGIAYLLKILDSYQKRPEAQILNMFAVLPALEISSVSKNEAKIAANNLLHKYNNQAIILFDSFEDLDVNQNEKHLVLAGFLKAVAELQQPPSRVDVRCCIPAEIYHRMLDISSNILKDFSRTNVLHWSSGELLKIAAVRYRKFLELWFPPQFKTFANLYDFEKRDQVIQFWSKILPDSVPNTKSDQTEQTIPYILRHTQLLPRQLLTLLNDILAETIRTDGDPLEVQPSVVSSQVRLKENELAMQIMESYKITWPEASVQIPKVLARLNMNVVSFGTLEVAMRQANVYHSGNVEDANDLFQMLGELGVIGRLIERTDRYVKAVFEYIEPHRLRFNDFDELCIHPLFTEAFGVIKEERVPENYLPVYPYGTELDESVDRRKRFSILG